MLFLREMTNSETVSAVGVHKSDGALWCGHVGAHKSDGALWCAHAGVFS